MRPATLAGACPASSNLIPSDLIAGAPSCPPLPPATPPCTLAPILSWHGDASGVSDMPTASGALIQHNTTRRPCKRPYEFAGVQLGCGASLRALRRSDEEPSISATSSSFKTMMECSLVMSRWMTAHATRRWCSNSSVCVCVCVCVCMCVRACVRASERSCVSA